MSFLLPCPNCGMRSVDEFRFGGEMRASPEGDTSAEAWRAYLYERANVDGPQQEWWYHRLGCRRWFTAVRDTSTNTVLETSWLRPGKGVKDAEARDAGSTAAAGDVVSGLE
ncbi:MAG: sarcosine oxidase subunit delta [Chloroflexota bacterium]